MRCSKTIVLNEILLSRQVLIAAPAGLSRTEGRQVVDESLLGELVMPQIKEHRGEWIG